MKNQVTEYKFREEFEQVGFEIVQLDYLFSKHTVEERTTPHRLKFYAILFIIQGNGKHEIDFKQFPYKAKSILFIGKDQIHAWKASANMDGFMMFFTEDFLYQNQIKFKDLSYSYPFNSILYEPVVDISKPDKFDSFHSLIHYIHEEYKTSNHQGKQEILQCLLRTFILKIRAQSKQENTEVSKKDKALFIRFQRMLNEKINISRNAKDYCQWLNISFRKLNDVCKTLTNLSLKEFIDKTLILKSKKYLSDHDKSISEISYRLGFQEVTNFSKYFKKHTSHTPKSFQNSI